MRVECQCVSVCGWVTATQPYPAKLITRRYLARMACTTGARPVALRLGWGWLDNAGDGKEEEKKAL